MENKIRKQVGHYYKIIDRNFVKEGEVYLVEYMGREEGYECMVCGKGNNAHGFNHYYGYHKNEAGEKVLSAYETFFYGTEHLPEIIEEVSREDLLAECDYWDGEKWIKE